MLVGREGHGQKEYDFQYPKGVGIALGVILLAFGEFMGIENVQAPGHINILIFNFSVASILLGSIMLWLVFKKKRTRNLADHHAGGCSLP